MSTLRDAHVAALTLDTFNRHADKVDMANVAQLVNNLQSLFLADGDRFVATPNFHVYTMYRPHQGAKAVRIEVQAPDLPFRAGGRDLHIFRLAGSASRTAQNELFVSLVHTHATEAAQILLRLRGGKAARVRHTTLTHNELNAHNTFDRPGTVVPRQIESKSTGRAPQSEVGLRLPPASVNVFSIQLG
jgi:alpha-N-arabinofuranosidase